MSYDILKSLGLDHLDASSPDFVKTLERMPPQGAPGVTPAPRSMGYIVRTNAEGQARESLAEDIDYLGKLWANITEGTLRARVGERIYEDLNLPLRALRDLMRPSIEKVRVDSRETLERAQRFVVQFMPELAERVEHYPGERPIFDLYGVEDCDRVVRASLEPSA